VLTAEPATFAAFPACRRLGTPLGTTGRVPGQFRAQDPHRSVSSTVLGHRQCPYCPTGQTRWPGHLILQDMRPSRICRASEASDTLLAPLLDQDIDTVHQTVLSQRERCQEAFLATRDSLLESLDPQSAKSVIEASSCLEESGSRSYPSPQRSGSAISRYRQLYTHGLCFQGLRLTAGTVER
jgi:hypothetical protein